MFVYKGEKLAIPILKILCASVQNMVAWATRNTGIFIHVI
jgi:hypothetical protein